jgi:hypothetical protein
VRAEPALHAQPLVEVALRENGLARQVHRHLIASGQRAYRHAFQAARSIVTGETAGVIDDDQRQIDKPLMERSRIAAESNFGPY